METFKLTTEYIELCSLLKLAGPMLSGGQAKFMISQGLVSVDNQVETRKKCKIRAGQVVGFEGKEIILE
jgi:ribosome-associated protein